MHASWWILYRVTDSTAAVVALMGAQLLLAGFCFVRFRKALAANSWSVPMMGQAAAARPQQF
jgi:hypothetical protein